jgi:very-short-patch-repair endonuclease
MGMAPTFDPSNSGRPDRAAVNRRIGELLAEQSDVVAFSQLAALGLSRSAVLTRLNAGHLFPLWPNVYTGRPGPLTKRGEHWAAHLAVGPAGALAQTTAADVLDFAAARPREGLHVVRKGTHEDYDGLRFHATVWLPAADIVSVEGLCCTSPARTLLDCAAVVTADRLDDMLDRAVLLQKYDGLAIERVMRERPRAPGVRQLRAGVAKLDGTAGAHRNRFERKATALIRESQLIGMPIVNSVLEGFEPDLMWLNTRAIIECDGRDHHRSPAQLAADARKEVLLLSLGYVILRLRWAHVVYEPARTLARIEQFVLANSAPPVAGVAGRVVF